MYGVLHVFMMPDKAVCIYFIDTYTHTKHNPTRK